MEDKEKKKKVDEKSGKNNNQIEINPELKEALSISQRRQRSMTMRKHKAKIAAARKRMSRRPADKERLKKRAKLAAIKMVRSKISGGKAYKDLSPGDKAKIDDKVKKRSAAVARFAKKLLPHMKRKDRAKITGNSLTEDLATVERTKDRHTRERQKLSARQENEMDNVRTNSKRRQIRAINRESFDEDFEFLMLIKEAATMDQIADVVNAEIKRGRDFMEIIWQISRAASIGMTAREIEREYIKKYGRPKDEMSDKESTNRLKKKYGFREETHDDMDGKTPSGPSGAGLEATKRLKKKYIKDTPGQIEESKETCQLVGRNQIKQFESVVDKLFKKYGIDFEFTKHFGERMSHERNNPCITLKELADFIKKIYARQGKSLKGVAGAEAVIKDMQKDLNIPVVVKYDRRNDEFDVVMKTIMRKRNFKTPNEVIKY